MKKRIILFIFLFIFFCSVIFNALKFYNNTYILLGNNTVWKYDGNKIKNSKINPKIFNLEKLKNFSSNDKFLVSYNGNSWEKYTNDMKLIISDKKFNAYTGKYSFNEINSYYETSRISDEDLEKINQLFSSYSIKGSDNIPYFNKTKIDIDSDGNYETIYTINNFFQDSLVDEDAYSVIAMYKDSEIIPIHIKSYDYSKMMSEYVSFLNNIVEYDGNIGVILYNIGNSESKEECFSFYKYDKSTKKFNNQVSCEEAE